jgi:hypothetical protein
MAVRMHVAEAAYDLAPVMPGERPIDLVHLARHTLGDRSLEREVLRLFQRQSMLLVERLRRTGAGTAWCEAAHTMTGSARGIGAWRVARAAEEAERIGRADCATTRFEALSVLEVEVTAANAYIADLLSVH